MCIRDRLNGHAVRAPVLNASLTDCVFELKRPTTAEEVNALFKSASESVLAGILGYEMRPLVSADYTNDSRSAIAGAKPLTNFFKITAPLIAKPLTPLLISAFAFNFNNFVLISLLTDGRPDFLNTKLPAGTTDILVSYTLSLIHI